MSHPFWKFFLDSDYWFGVAVGIFSAHLGRYLRQRRSR